MCQERKFNVSGMNFSCSAKADFPLTNPIGPLRFRHLPLILTAGCPGKPGNEHTDLKRYLDRKREITLPELTGSALTRFPNVPAAENLFVQIDGSIGFPQNQIDFRSKSLLEIP